MAHKSPPRKSDPGRKGSTEGGPANFDKTDRRIKGPEMKLKLPLLSQRTFLAFQSRNYRLYFYGQSVSLIGTWMQRTAVSWVVYTLTHSAFMLGVAMLCTQFPSFLLSTAGGVVSDRYDRYKVLLITQISSLVQSVLLAILILLGHYTVWEILGISIVLGAINAFDVPARQSLVYEMVDDKEHL